MNIEVPPRGKCNWEESTKIPSGRERGFRGQFSETVLFRTGLLILGVQSSQASEPESPSPFRLMRNLYFQGHDGYGSFSYEAN
jgi:hypothetical protein